MSSNRESWSKTPLGADLIIPGLALAFAVYFFISIADLVWEAKANGVLIGAVLVALIGVQCARIAVQVAKGGGDLGFDPLLRPREVLPKRLGMVLITIAFIAALPWLGVTLDVLLAMAVGLYLMGVRRRAHIVWTSLAVAACTYLMFIAFLDSDVPHGPVERLISLLLPG